MVDIEYIRKRFGDGEYAISDHAIIEARKDGIDPGTVEKLEWAAINGKVIEEYIIGNIGSNTKSEKNKEVKSCRNPISIFRQEFLCLRHPPGKGKQWGHILNIKHSLLEMQGPHKP